MKKILSVFLAIVLLICTMSTNAFNLIASAACENHEYSCACDQTCNECDAKREVVAHSYNECFKASSNPTFLAEWTKTVNETGVFAATPAYSSDYFSHHYLLVTDKNGCEVCYNEQFAGWPLVKDQTYTIRLKSLYDDSLLSDIDFKLDPVINNLFPDTQEQSWYSDAVFYSVAAGVMSGYQNGKFGTSDNIQRQDFLVMLARYDGVNLDNYNYKSKFADVARSSYYEAAVNWGTINGIVNGYSHNGMFGVSDNITREQMVTFIYRYAKYKDCRTDVSPNKEDEVLKQYSDYKNVSLPEFKDAVLWALEQGIIRGKTESTIAPQGNAQRCEVAQILYNIHLNNSLPGVRPCVHSFVDANCTEPKTCKICGLTQGSSLGHSYKAATCELPTTCSVCGKTTGSALGHNYVAGECERCKDYSENYCPKLYFTGDMSKITDPKQTSKKIECDIDVQYRSREQIVNCTAKIKIQGSSSTKWRKKNYTINFYQDGNYTQKQKIDVGWGAQSKYCLKANWIDKTHSRNVVTAKLAGMIQNQYGLLTVAPNNGAVDGFPVEIYINGEFHGLYTMNIPKDEWQFGMDKDNPNHIVIGGGGWEDPVKFKAIPTEFSTNGFEVEAGPENEETLQKLQRLVDFVLNSSDDDFKNNFTQYLNLDSTLNYYIMMNYAWTPDNTGKNMLLATYDGNVWYPSLYDLDTTWGTHWEGNKEYNYSTGFINGNDSMLWSRFEKHFKKEIAARYFELREDILDPNNVMNMFNDFYNTIPKEVLDRETAKWTLPDDPIPGYDFTQIQRYLNTVIPRLDERFESWK